VPFVLRKTGTYLFLSDMAGCVSAELSPSIVTPAKAGAQLFLLPEESWVPACAGMTNIVGLFGETI
jgi:hypothetical protein